MAVISRWVDQLEEQPTAIHAEFKGAVGEGDLNKVYWCLGVVKESSDQTMGGVIAVVWTELGRCRR